MANLQKKGMPYIRLGNSGLKVSKIILGCASYGTSQWQNWVLPEEESIGHIKATYYDAGINAFDTANVSSLYTPNSERVLGEAIKQLNLPRDEIVIMTKASHLTSDPNHYDVGSIPWSPLGRGLLARPSKSESTTRGKVDLTIRTYSQGSEGTETIVDRVEEVAKKRGISMAQVALAWMFQKDGVTTPILGATSSEHLQDIIGSIQVQLTPDEVKYLEEPYFPQAIIRHK